MPDRKKLPGSVLVTDRRAENLIAGIGNVNLSPLGAFLEGFESSAANWANISAKQLETNRLNDPDRLAAEQLRRELDNQTLQEAIAKARIQRPFIQQQIEAELAASRAGTQTQVLTNQVYEQTGLEAALTAIRAKNQDIAASQMNVKVAQDALTRNQKFGDREMLSQIEAREAATRVGETNAETNARQQDRLDQIFIEQGASGSGSSSAFSKEERARRRDQIDAITKEENFLQQKRSAILQQAATEERSADQDRRDFSKYITGDRTAKRAYNELITAQQAAQTRLAEAKKTGKGLDTAQKEFDSSSSAVDAFIQSKVDANLIPAPRSAAAPANVDPINQRLEELNEKRRQLSEIDYIDNQTAGSAEERRYALELGRAQRKAAQTQKSKGMVGVVANNYNEAMIAIDAAPAEGENSQAVLPHLFVMAQAAKQEKDPAVKLQTQEQISDVIEKSGGIESLTAAIDASEKDPVRRDAFKKSIYGAVVQSGNIELLTPQQQTMLGAGLSSDRLADPDKTAKDVVTLMTPQSAQVLNQEYMGIFGSDLFAAARKASANGTRGYTVITDNIEQGNTPPTVDSAQQSAPKGTVVKFVGTGEDAKNITGLAFPEPGTKNSHILQLLSDVSSKVGGAETKNAQATQGIQGAAQGQAVAVEAAAGQQQRANAQPAQAPAAPAPTSVLEGLVKTQLKVSQAKLSKDFTPEQTAKALRGEAETIRRDMERNTPALRGLPFNIDNVVPPPPQVAQPQPAQPQAAAQTQPQTPGQAQPSAIMQSIVRTLPRSDSVSNALNSPLTTAARDVGVARRDASLQFVKDNTYAGMTVKGIQSALTGLGIAKSAISKYSQEYETSFNSLKESGQLQEGVQGVLQAIGNMSAPEEVKEELSNAATSGQ